MICSKINDNSSFTLKMNKTFGNMLLVQPLITSLSIIISLFCVMVNFWYAGIGYIIFAYVQLLAICTVGQTVQDNVKLKNEYKHACVHASEESPTNSIFIYFQQNLQLQRVLSESEWFLFPIEDQRLYLMALMSAQHAKEFWIGSFLPYNMETASKVKEVKQY